MDTLKISLKKYVERKLEGNRFTVTPLLSDCSDELKGWNQAAMGTVKTSEKLACNDQGEYMVAFEGLLGDSKVLPSGPYQVYFFLEVEGCHSPSPRPSITVEIGDFYKQQATCKFTFKVFALKSLLLFKSEIQLKKIADKKTNPILPQRPQLEPDFKVTLTKVKDSITGTVETGLLTCADQGLYRVTYGPRSMMQFDMKNMKDPGVFTINVDGC